MARNNQTAAAYMDCFRIMDQAIKVGGIRVEFPSRERATVFRHRCYRARAMLYRVSERSTPAGTLPSTAYDDILIRLESDMKEEGLERVLVFLLRSKQEGPAVTDLDGNPITEEPIFTDLKIEGITLDE